MKKIITALSNPELNKKLSKEKSINIICKDIQYREAILEVLEKIKFIDIIFINEKIQGQISFEKLIKKIKEINKKVEIIFIKKNKEINKETEIKEIGIDEIYYESEITYENILKIINHEKIEQTEKKNNKNKISNIIKNKKNNNKKNTNKIITVSGVEKVGKSIITIKILKKLARTNKKILVIDLNIKKQKLYLLLNRKKYSKKIKEKIKYLNRNKIEKLDLKEKNLIKKFEIKINKNTNLVSGLDLIIKDETIYKEQEIKNFILNILKIYKKEYNYIIVNLQLEKYLNLEKTIIKNSDINVLVMESNKIGINMLAKIMEKYKKDKITLQGLHIVVNKYNWKSISIYILKNIFGKNLKINKIRYNKNLDKKYNKKLNF